MSFSGFIQQYYIDPITYGTGYNIFNTLTYAVILVIAVVLIYRLLKRLNISIDQHFFVGVLPFIALGGILRALEDFFVASGMGKNIFLITPLIYVTMFVIALASLFIAKFIQRHTNYSYHKIWFVIGVIVSVIALSQLSVVNPDALLIMSGITGMWIVLFLIVKQLFKNHPIGKFLSLQNSFVILAHMFDATTTFVALEYFSYFEQHVLTGFIIGSLGTASIFITKLVVVSIVLYAFDWVEKKDERTYLKLIVLILGLGPGLRNFLRLVAGV